MKKWFFRILGTLLMVGALAGVLMSITGIYLVWQMKPLVHEKIDAGLDLIERAVTATEDLMSVLDSSLDNIHTSLGDLESITTDAAGTIESTTPVVSSVADLFGEDFSLIVEETQRSLGNAEQSAKIVDDTLSVITSIMAINPFQSAPSYSSENNLQSSIAQVSDQLSSLPQTLDDVQGGLNTTADNLEILQTDMENTSGSITDIKSNVEDAQNTVSEYFPILTEARESVDKVNQYLTVAVDTTAWGVTVLLLWLIVAQAGLFTQGMELINRK